jgi:hypothetical protein
MRRTVITAAVLVGCLFCLSCGKKHVGETVDTTMPRWCQWQGTDRDCLVWVGHILFEASIKKGSRPGTYVIAGTVDPTSKGKQRLAQNWQGRFSMFVAKDNVIVDNVGFLPQSPESDTSGKLPFSIEYNRPEGFDAISFGYEITVGPVR